MELDNDDPISSQQDAQRESIERCIQSLVHACHCLDASCSTPTCLKIKRVVIHTNICRRKLIGHCPICMQIFTLSLYHAKQCQETNCSVVFCSSIKKKIKKDEVQQQVQQANMAAMNTHAMGAGSSSAPPAAAPPSPPLQQMSASTPQPPGSIIIAEPSPATVPEE